MASLGKLWFDLGLKDKTEKDAEEIRKNVEKRLKDLNVSIGLDGHALKSSIENALRGQQFKIDVVVDKANTTKLIQEAIARAGINNNVSASDVRAERVKQIQEQMSNAAERHRKQVEKLQAQIDNLRERYKRASSASRQYAGTLDNVTKNMRTQLDIAVQLRNQLAGIFSIYAAERFLEQLISIGGEFQQQRVALQSMFQDATKADILFGQIKELAVISPFEFKELAGYTKQLAAFNIPYEEMYDTTKRLADISAGVGVDMGRIILAYGQVRSAEFLKGSELRQFTEAGIPLLQHLADKFTELEGRVVSVGEVFDKISKREVPFQMVKEVLWDLTNEGGQFYNMQGVLADTLAGKWENLRDAYDVMLSDIAEKNNSTLGKGLDLLTDTMSNWESLSKYILSAAAAYGSYKAALLVLTAVERSRMSLNQLQAIVNATRATQGLTAATKAQVVVQRVLNAVTSAFSANPLIATASAIATIIGAFFLFNERAKSTQEIIIDMNESLGKLQNNFNEVSSIDKLIDEYEELSKKQDRTAEESKRLETVTSSLRSHFKGAAMDVDIYSNSLQLSIEKMRKLNAEQKRNYEISAQASISEAQKQERALVEKIQFLNKQIASGSGRFHIGESANMDDFFAIGWVTDKDISDMANLAIQYEDELKRIRESTQNTKDFLQSLGKTPDDTNLEDTLKGWRKAIRDFISGNDGLKNLIPKEAEEYQDWLKRLKEDLSDAKDELARKEGTTGLFEEDDIKSARKRVQELQSIVDKFNITIDDSKKSKKDPVAERFQKQLDLLKDAMNAYEKYESMLGKEGAIKAVNDDSRFAGLNFNPDTYRKELEKLQSDLQKIAGDNSSRIKVADSIGKALTDIDQRTVKKNTERILDVMRRTIEENTSRWDLYKDLFNITGDREMSMRFAFGIDASSMNGIYSQIDYLKKELVQITGRTFEELDVLTDSELKSLLGSKDEQVKNLLNQIRNTTKQESDAIIKNVVQLIQKYASEADKIKTLEAQRDNALKELRNSSIYSALGEGEKKRAEEAILKEYANQISEIREESAKLLPIWQDLFGDTTDMGYKSLRKLVEESKKFANTAKEVQNPQTGKTEYKLTGTDKDGNIKEVTISLEEYLRLLKQIRDVEKEMEKDNPFETLVKSIRDFRNAPDGSDEKERALKQIGISAAECADMINSVTDSWGSMFDALGNESLSDALSFAGDMIGEIGNLAEGLTSVNPIQMATSALSFIPNIITNIANFHDKKLDRAIQKSALEVEKLQNAYTNLQTVIERQLGNITEQQTDNLIKNLEKQRSEIQKQMQLEDDKKKTDSSKIEDYKQQIVELNDQIKYFYEDLANELYSINLKDWAGQLSDSIVDAWRSGENAAEAFKQTASDILADVANEMLKMAILEPMFENLRSKLPQMMSDGMLDDNELGVIASELLNIQGGYEEALAYLDRLDSEIQKKTNGELSLKDTSSSSSSSSSSGTIQASEETMQLTNSYLNAIRQDVSVQRNLMENIGTTLLPTISITAQAQLQQLNAIVENTRLNAEAATAIRSFLQNDLAGVITVGNGGKAIRIK